MTNGSTPLQSAMTARGSSARRLRVAMIGVGGWARGHLDRLALRADLEIAAICDINPASIERAKQGHDHLLSSAVTYADYRQLLSEQRPDAVIICTPHREHYQQVLDSLGAGAHVLVEKPLVNSSSQASEVIRATHAAKAVVGIAYQRHTMPEFRYIYDCIRRHEWGAVRSICAYQQEAWRERNVGTWRQQPEISGGGYLHDGGSHLMDTVLWCSGLVPRCVGALQDYARGPVDVNTVMSIEFVEGPLGTLAMMGDTPGWAQRLIIGCERATVSYASDSGVHVHRPDGSVSRVPSEQMPLGTDVVANFIDAIAGCEPIAAPLECGLAVMRLTEAATESARREGTVVAVRI